MGPDSTYFLSACGSEFSIPPVITSSEPSHRELSFRLFPLALVAITYLRITPVRPHPSPQNMQHGMSDTMHSVSASNYPPAPISRSGALSIPAKEIYLYLSRIRPHLAQYRENAGNAKRLPWAPIAQETPGSRKWYHGGRTLARLRAPACVGSNAASSPTAHAPGSSLCERYTVTPMPALKLQHAFRVKEGVHSLLELPRMLSAPRRCSSIHGCRNALCAFPTSLDSFLAFINHCSTQQFLIPTYPLPVSRFA